MCSPNVTAKGHVIRDIVNTEVSTLSRSVFDGSLSRRGIRQSSRDGEVLAKVMQRWTRAPFGHLCMTEVAI